MDFWQEYPFSQFVLSLSNVLGRMVGVKDTLFKKADIVPSLMAIQIYKKDREQADAKIKKKREIIINHDTEYKENKWVFMVLNIGRISLDITSKTTS